MGNWGIVGVNTVKEFMVIIHLTFRGGGLSFPGRGLQRLGPRLGNPRGLQGRYRGIKEGHQKNEPYSSASL